ADRPLRVVPGAEGAVRAYLVAALAQLGEEDVGHGFVHVGGDGDPHAGEPTPRRGHADGRSAVVRLRWLPVAPGGVERGAGPRRPVLDWHFVTCRMTCWNAAALPVRQSRGACFCSTTCSNMCCLARC